MIDPARLPMWVIYDHPSDYPDSFVARLHFTLPQPELTVLLMVSPNLQALQLSFAAAGLTPIARSVEDDSVIIESWL